MSRSDSQGNHSARPLKSFLFLQGVCSPFFARLAKALRAEGQSVKCVAFNVGDVLYGDSSRLYFSADMTQLEDFYSQLMHEQHITDLVLFGDQRPVHQAAKRVARQHGAQVHVFEEGYFRPYWITLERDGVNNHSRLPRDPRWYQDVGKRIPHYGEGDAFSLSFSARALHDVAYHLGGAFNPLCFPHYRTHAPFNAAIEYTGFLRQRLRLRKARDQDTELIRRVSCERQPTFLLPLQLDSDAQIRQHSPFADMSDVLHKVLSSFSRHAPGQARLLVKNHPLTPGLVDYRHVTQAISRLYAITDRVDFIESGCMPTLLSHVAGVVTVNSTVGASALQHQRPTFTLATPIYAVPGLTHQGCLESFWREAQRPDETLFQDFRNTVIHTTQVNGGFYTRSGIDMAVNNSLQVLMANTSRIESFL